MDQFLDRIAAALERIATAAEGFQPPAPASAPTPVAPDAATKPDKKKPAPASAPASALKIDRALVGGAVMTVAKSKDRDTALALLEQFKIKRAGELPEPDFPEFLIAAQKASGLAVEAFKAALQKGNGR